MRRGLSSFLAVWILAALFGLAFESTGALAAAGVDERDGGAGNEAADASDRDAGDAARHLDAGRRGEEEFVVLAALEGKIERPRGFCGEVARAGEAEISFGTDEIDLWKFARQR